MRILVLAGRRLAASIPTLILILIGVFLLLQFAPGDTVDAHDGADGRRRRRDRDASCANSTGSICRSRRSSAIICWRLVRLDLGFSSIYGKPVASVILERLPPTILLMTASLSFAFFFGLVFGVIAARGVNRWPDTLISTLGLVFYATPSFWFGLMAIVVFSVYLQWLPPGGFEDIGTVADRHLARARYRQPSGAADADARADLPRDLPAHHAGLDARGAEPRFRPHRPRQGARRDPRGDAPRAAQRAPADGDADRPAGRHHAGRLGRGRKRVLAAGPRTACL